MTGGSKAEIPLKLELSDFGPIADANIDLRPMTVFIGRSNVGKSYLATLIYSLHRYFGDNPSFGNWHVSGGGLYFTPRSGLSLPKEFQADFLETSRSHTDALAGPRKGKFTITPGVAQTLATGMQKSSETLRMMISRSFGVNEISKFPRKGCNRSGLKLCCFRNGSPKVSEIDFKSKPCASTADTTR